MYVCCTSVIMSTKALFKQLISKTKKKKKQKKKKKIIMKINFTNNIQKKKSEIELTLQQHCKSNK